MALIFRDKGHEYLSKDEPVIDWISVTSLVGKFKSHFDGPVVAKNCSKKPSSIWYKMTVDAILKAWEDESIRASTLGTWYHNLQESNLCKQSVITKSGVSLPVVKPIIEANGDKVAPDQKLLDGIYPEHFMYLKSVGVCGQADLVEVINQIATISDHKTNKELKMVGYSGYNGVTRLAQPLNHLDDCHLQHYTLQLSLYMFILLKHNPRIGLGELVINHVKFDEIGRTAFDNPIYALDREGNAIIKQITYHRVPFLKNEVISILHWLNAYRATQKQVQLKKAA